MPPTAALATLYCTEADLEVVMGVVGKVARADDNRDQQINTAEQVYLDRGRTWGTERVNWFCLSRYDAQYLAQSWLVNYWASVAACYWLSTRRGNPAPGSFDDLYRECVDDMKLVHAGSYDVPGIGERDVGWPAWSNVRVDILKPLRKILVERPLSERSATDYRQVIDSPAEWIVDNY